MNKIFGFLLTIGVFSSLCLAEEFSLFRLSDKVGDTVDVAEREQYSLFPGITNFESARILIRNDTNYFAEITSRKNDTLERFFLKLTPKELERIVFCIDNSDTIKKQITSDEYAGLAYQRFWDQIESKRQSNIEEKIQSQSTAEDRFIWILHGTTCGSAIGGAIGSWAAIEFTGTSCITSYYRINHTVFWSSASIGTGVGTLGGYILGGQAVQNKPLTLTRIKEGSGWREGCAYASVLPGIALGLATFIFASGFYYGKTDILSEIENDPHHLTIIPGIITGLCVTIEIISLGYRIGRSIDRKKAAQAAKEQKNKK